MKTFGKRALKFAGYLFLILGLGVLSLGFFSVPEDEPFEPEEYGAGSSSVQPSWTGLQRAFPAVNGETTPAMAELGNLLFYDPALSQQNDISCAHCHHPDFGFSDGLPLAVGAGGQGAGPNRTGGVGLGRSTPGLWNTGFSRLLFWDGRVDSLEEQAITPLTHPDEMAVQDQEALSEELAAIPGYPPLFEAAFGSPEVTFRRVTIALAAFERGLVSQDSPFDRYAAGDFNALSPAQRRGLNLFRSAALRCFECHQAPTFGSDTLRAIGVPDAEAGSEPFKVPNLRNVALTAPYMHNGAFATLEEVVRFYADGAGNADGLSGLDPFVMGFELTDQEVADLVAFMAALTDESGMPAVPVEVPSGLPVVDRLDNPARELAAGLNTGSSDKPPEDGGPRTIRVQAGESIQAAVDRARPGDIVEIAFGTYHETVVVDISNLTLLGMPDERGGYPVLDGRGILADAVIASGNKFEAGYLKIINYTSNGVLVEGVTGVHLHHLWAENTGVYGLYPVQSTDVLIEESVVIGANDAGIYAGQSTEVEIRRNEVYRNVLGIEAENTVATEIYDNHAHDNTMGILVVLLPNLTSKVSLDTRVYDNLIENNNHENFAQEGTAAALAPSGSGIALIGADGVVVFGNTFRGNKTAGVGIFHLNIAFPPERINVPATPENIRVHGNIFENNGYDADAFVRDMGIPGADILWDVSGNGVALDEAEAEAFPPLVPTSRWPQFAYNIYWRLLNFLIGLL